MAFAPGLPAFAAQYALARGFYALSDTRTPFLLTLVIAAANAAGSAAAYTFLPTRYAVAGMAAAYAVACTLGVACTAWTLHRRLRAMGDNRGMQGLFDRRLLLTHAGLVAACVPGAIAAYAVAEGATRILGNGLPGDLAGLVLGSTAIAASLLLLARPLHLTEVAELTAPFARRLGTRGRHRKPPERWSA